MCACQYCCLQVCAVFAQLTVGNTYQGPHVFVVRIRDDAGRIMPGVRIVDCGPKMGLNGVDNGRIWFSGVRVPLDCLLDRYAQVSPAGVYSSAIPSVSARFGVFPQIGCMTAASSPSCGSDATQWLSDEVLDGHCVCLLPDSFCFLFWALHDSSNKCPPVGSKMDC
jgi:hypothetical protein